MAGIGHTKYHIMEVVKKADRPLNDDIRHETIEELI